MVLLYVEYLHHFSIQAMTRCCLPMWPTIKFHAQGKNSGLVLLLVCMDVCVKGEEERLREREDRPGRHGFLFQETVRVNGAKHAT